MKFNIFAFVALLAVGVAASPVADPGDSNNNYCKQYTYNPPQCPKCPYMSSRDLFDDLEEREEEDVDPRSPDEIFARDGGNNNYCQKPCPPGKQVCQKYGWKNNYRDYSAYAQQTINCGNSWYKVVIKIENCPGGQCLVVYFYDKDGGYKKHYMGAWPNNQPSISDPNGFNYNGYCQGNRCSVPLGNLPGYPYLCGKTIYVGVDSGQCYKNGQYGGGRNNWIQYIAVQIQCNGQKYCQQYCCCP